MSRLQLTYWQRRRLRRQLKAAGDARVLRRTLAILDFDRGRPAADIAELLGVTRQSVYNWVTSYARCPDPATLADGTREGRPRLLTDDEEGLLRLLLSCSPQWLGYAATGWALPLLQEELQRGGGVRPSDDTVRRCLRRLGYVWKRPRYVLAPDPEREKKTAHPPADSGLAQAQRGAGGGRDRPVAVPSAAGGLVVAR
jgi:transposase